MPLKTYKPITPSRRFMTTNDFSCLSKKRPEKSLLVKIKKSGGRNNTGKVMVRHRGGGHKRLYRIIDFKRDKNIPGKVVSIEYDPNRNSWIALICYNDGEKRYIIAPEGLQIGDVIMSGENVDIKIGNALPLRNIPTGTFVHNIELYPGRGGVFARAAGASAQIMAKEGDYAIVKMRSGEIRKIRLDCMATIGQVGNIEYENISLGKAGRKRWLGIRPTVRGAAMNPVDHPHGGGEGKASEGRAPVTPWGKPARGVSTRRNKNTNKYIIKRRK